MRVRLDTEDILEAVRAYIAERVPDSSSTDLVFIRVSVDQEEYAVEAQVSFRADMDRPWGDAPTRPEITE